MRLRDVNPADLGLSETTWRELLELGMRSAMAAAVAENLVTNLRRQKEEHTTAPPVILDFNGVPRIVPIPKPVPAGEALGLMLLEAIRYGDDQAQARVDHAQFCMMPMPPRMVPR